MNHDEKKLKRQIQEMQLGHETRKRQRQAAKLRRAMTTDGECETFDARTVLRTEADALDDLALPTRARRRGSARPARAPVREGREDSAANGGAGGRVGSVSAVFSGACRVRLDDEERDCRLAPAIVLEQRTALAVGDQVRVSEHGAVTRVEEVLPRRSALARPDPSNAHLERVLAANVDVILIATALRAPGIKPGLIDRVLLAASAALQCAAGLPRFGGCAAVVCVNKLDLADEDREAAAAELGLLEPYVASGVEIVRCSARTGEGIESLRERVAGRTAVLVGQSGCGKTSLLNALAPGLGLRTGASRESDGKGRHTTSASSLHAIPGGGFLIDTPGVRQFGLWEPGEEALRAAFPEVLALAANCRFRDCRHVSEPGCAVRSAVAEGTLAARRLASFHRVREAS